MKKTIIIIFILSISQFVWGQKFKYEEIIEYIKRKDYDISYSLLYSFQGNNPEFANTYFQLGNISYDWMLNMPINDFSEIEYLANNTKVYYGLCLSKLTASPRDVKKNRELYRTIPEFENVEKIDNEAVMSYINKKLKNTESHYQDSKKSYEHFCKLVEKYNQTVDIFLSVIENYQKLNDVYLEEKSSILKSTNELINNFDSTLYFYEQYKLSLENQKLKNYKLELKLRDIKTYSLEGITRTNFLEDTIKLWNYKIWANEIQDYLNKNIEHFRETITNTNKDLTQKEEELSISKKYSNSFKNYEIDQTVFFEIEKYDYNSVISDLFKYKKAKIDYLVKHKRIFNDRNNHSVSPTNRAIEYYELTNLKTKVDTLLEKLTNRMTKEDYEKHKNFFYFYYNGYESFLQYLQKEKSDIKELYANDLNNLNFFTSRDVFNVYSKKMNINYDQKELPLTVSVVNPILAMPNKYYTVSIDENKLGHKYLTGYHKAASGPHYFIAKISNNQVEWFKSGDEYAAEYGTFVKATSDGCLVIIRSETGGEKENTIIKLNADGKKVYKRDIASDKYPRFLEYDEIGQNFIIALHGYKIDSYEQTADSLYFMKFDMEKNEIVWQNSFLFDGNLVNIIKMDKTYKFIANYRKISIDGLSFSSEKPNLISMDFTTDGKYVDSKRFEFNNFNGTFAYKINSQTINVMGYKNAINPLKTNIKKLPEPLYLILDKKDNIVFKNF